jgi:DNA replication protein DnaC
VTGCPENRCDGSGFLFDEAARRAYPCSCRPQRLARRRAAAVAGRLPKRFREVGFDREPVVSIERANPPVLREVRAYVRAVSDRLAEGRGIWFTGSVGTGKTTLAMLVSKAAMEADHTVAIYSLPRLLAMLRDTYDDASVYSLTDLVDRLCSVELLHVDDVGAEQTSSWVLEQLYTIVNTRYEDGRAMVLTTNLDEDALRAQIGERTVSRIHEMCGMPLGLFGDDQRRGAEGAGIIAMPAPAPADARGPGRWREDPPAPDDDAFWEHGAGTGATAPAYGRPRGGGRGGRGGTLD